MICALASKASGQVAICEDKKSYHPVDIKAMQIMDSLIQAGIDTVIVYRHWLGTNGFNGYGKVLWLNKGQCFQCKIEFENRTNKIKKIAYSILQSDSVFRFFFVNHIDTIRNNPVQQDMYISHDAEHYFYISYGPKNYCYLIGGLKVRYNPDNGRSELIYLLADENVSAFSVDGVRIRYDTTKTNAQVYRKVGSKGDIVFSKEGIVPNYLQSVFLNINFRDYADLKFSEDSFRYEFEILSIDALGKTEFKIRVGHDPVSTNQEHIINPGYFIATYRVVIKKYKGEWIDKQVQYLLTEL